MKLILFIAIIFLTIILFSCSNNYYKGEKSNHFDGKTFSNLKTSGTHSFYSFLKWQLNKEPGFWPAQMVKHDYDKPPISVNDGELRVSFVGHATVLIQIAGLNILTDPLWAKRASPFSFIGPKRITEAGIKLEDLPKIDLILISHNHYDHLDLKTVEKIASRDKPQIIVPLGNDTIIKNYNSSIAVTAADWDDVIVINEKVKIHLEPAQHWSARGLFDRNKALWCAFTIETIYGNIYFAGDTGFNDHFAIAKQKHKKFRLALIPIGAFQPEWFMKNAHVNPVEAVQAFEDLGADYALAIHYGAFKLADDGYHTPAQEINKLYGLGKITPERFKLLDVGKYWFVPNEIHK
jgi:L-ascorbate metabolism protein UlaG (beta-lactamase superfamily)